MISIIVVQTVVCAAAYFLGVFIGRQSLKIDMQNKSTLRRKKNGCFDFSKCIQKDV